MERGKRKMSDPIKDHKLADLSDSYYHDEIIELTDRISLDVGAAIIQPDETIAGIDVDSFASRLSDHVDALAEMVWKETHMLFDLTPGFDYSSMFELLSWFDRYVPTKTMSEWRVYSDIVSKRIDALDDLVDAFSNLETTQFGGGFNLVEFMMPTNWLGKEVMEKCGFIASTYDQGQHLKRNYESQEIPF